MLHHHDVQQRGLDQVFRHTSIARAGHKAPPAIHVRQFQSSFRSGFNVHAKTGWRGRRFNHPRACRQHVRRKTVNCAIIGADEETVIGHSKTYGVAFDCVIHHQFAGGRLDGNHKAIAAGKECAARKRHRAETVAGCKPIHTRAIARGLFLGDGGEARGGFRQLGGDYY